MRHFGVSNFTPAQFALLQSRLPFTLATNQVEISPVHQPLLLDGTLYNYNNCVFVRWRGPALVVVVCLMMIISSRCVMNWLWWRRKLNAGSIEQVVYAWYYVYRRSRCQLSAQVKLSAYGQLSKQKH